MEIILDVTKSLEENATAYFEKAKKARKKLEGTKKALNKKINIKEKEIKRKKSEKREWFEKFHWSISSEGKLIIGGRDATTNEIIIKRHTETDDLVFHTDMRGSPFVVLKQGNKSSEKELIEAATLCLCYSKGWKDNIAIEVFYVKPEQLSKEGEHGEANAGKGAFVIKGTTKYLYPKLEFAVGIYNNKVLGGSEESIVANCNKYVKIVPGNEKTSEIAKKIKAKLNSTLHLDEFIKVLPAGGCKITK